MDFKVLKKNWEKVESMDIGREKQQHAQTSSFTKCTDQHGRDSQNFTFSNSKNS